VEGGRPIRFLFRTRLPFPAGLSCFTSATCDSPLSASGCHSVCTSSANDMLRPHLRTPPLRLAFFTPGFICSTRSIWPEAPGAGVGHSSRSVATPRGHRSSTPGSSLRTSSTIFGGSRFRRTKTNPLPWLNQALALHQTLQSRFGVREAISESENDAKIDAPRDRRAPSGDDHLSRRTPLNFSEEGRADFVDLFCHARVATIPRTSSGILGETLVKLTRPFAINWRGSVAKVGLAEREIPEPTPRRKSSRAQDAFLYDALVRLAWPLDLIFELAVSLGQLLGHLVCAARGITVEDGSLQRYRLTELEFVPALGGVHCRLHPSASAYRRASPEAPALLPTQDRSADGRPPSARCGFPRPTLQPRGPILAQVARG
jgi:hypothetical protein